MNLRVFNWLNPGKRGREVIFSCKPCLQGLKFKRYNLRMLNRGGM